MQLRARDRVPELAGLLSVVSLTLVFGAVLDLVPTGAVPRVPLLIDAIPHLNAVLSVVAIGTISLGWRAARRGNIARHRRAMAASFGLFAAFLALYLYRVSLAGPTPFRGPEAVARFVYYPVLAVHILLAVVCLPLLYYVALLGLTRPVSDLVDSVHPRVGRVAASLWLVSFALGTVVYAMVYVVW